jgi:hypothetical protein
MSKSFFRMQLPAIIIVCALLITLCAWKENKFAQAQQITSDTLPKKNEKQIRDFDDALKELERAQIELERNLKDIPPIDFDGEKVRAEVEKAMKDFDGEKLQLQAEQAMKHVDMQKVKEQMEAAMKQIDMEKIKVQMEEIKKIQVPKIEAEMKKIKPEIDKALEKAKVQIEKAKQDIKDYKAFEETLEKDGLINKKENYSIEHKNGQLIINGKVQPQAVYNKYRSFLEKHKKFKWKKDEDGLNLDND